MATQNKYYTTREIMALLGIDRAGVSWLAIRRGWRWQYCKVGRSIGKRYLAEDVQKEVDARTLKNSKLIGKTLDASSNV